MKCFSDKGILIWFDSFVAHIYNNVFIFNYFFSSKDKSYARKSAVLKNWLRYSRRSSLIIHTYYSSVMKHFDEGDIAIELTRKSRKGTRKPKWYKFNFTGGLPLVTIIIIKDVKLHLPESLNAQFLCNFFIFLKVRFLN